MPLTTWIKFLRRELKKKEWFGEQGLKCCCTAFAFAQRTCWSPSAYRRCISKRSSAELNPPPTALSLNVLHASLRKAVHLLLMETKWIILWPCVRVWYFKQHSEQSWLPWTLSFQGQRMLVWWCCCWWRWWWGWGNDTSLSPPPLCRAQPFSWEAT